MKDSSKRISGVTGMIDAHKRSSHVKHRKEGKYIKSVVYGGLDGIITTFAIVAGVTGASLTSEKKEMSILYQQKGLNVTDATKIVDILSKYQRPWVDAKLGEEIGLYPSKRSPFHSGVITFLSFVFFGFIPLIAYLIIKNDLGSKAFLVASILTAGTLFFLGAMKHKVTGKNWIKAGSEMLLVGGIAAIVAYLIGYMLSGLVYL